MENSKFDKSYLFIPNHKGVVPIHLIFKYCDSNYLEYFIEKFPEPQYYKFKDFANSDYLYYLILYNFDKIDIVLSKLNLDLNNILNEDNLLSIFYLFFDKINELINKKKLGIDVINSLYENEFSFNPIIELLNSSQVDFKNIDIDKRLNKILLLNNIENFNMDFWLKNEIESNKTPLKELIDINDRSEEYLEIIRHLYIIENIKKEIKYELLNNYTDNLSFILYFKRNKIDEELILKILDKIILEDKIYSINMIIIGLLDNKDELKKYNIEENCPICFEEVEKITSCLHGYCSECYKKLDICAICRVKNI